MTGACFDCSCCRLQFFELSKEKCFCCDFQCLDLNKLTYCEEQLFVVLWRTLFYVKEDGFRQFLDFLKRHFQNHRELFGIYGQLSSLATYFNKLYRSTLRRKSFCQYEEDFEVESKQRRHRQQKSAENEEISTKKGKLKNSLNSLNDLNNIKVVVNTICQENKRGLYLWFQGDSCVVSLLTIVCRWKRRRRNVTLTSCMQFFLNLSMQLKYSLNYPPSTTNYFIYFNYSIYYVYCVPSQQYQNLANSSVNIANIKVNENENVSGDLCTSYFAFKGRMSVVVAQRGRRTDVMDTTDEDGTYTVYTVYMVYTVYSLVRRLEEEEEKDGGGQKQPSVVTVIIIVVVCNVEHCPEQAHFFWTTLVLVAKIYGQRDIFIIVDTTLMNHCSYIVVLVYIRYSVSYELTARGICRASASASINVYPIIVLLTNGQTSGIFVCKFSFILMSVISFYSVELTRAAMWAAIFSHKTLVNHSTCYIFCQNSNATDSCPFRLKLKMKFKNYSSLLCTLIESTGLHTRTHTRINSNSFYIAFLNVKIQSLKLKNSNGKLDHLIFPTVMIFLLTNEHLGIYLILLLSGDIELNPGPFLNNKKLIILTQNCRGLNNILKLKHLMSNKNRIVKNNLFILALQETYLIDDSTISWCGKHIFTKAESIHSAGCITFLPETVRIIEKRDIDDNGHGHLAIVEGLGDRLTIVINVYAPVRSLTNQQVNFYETLEGLIEEFETKYVMHEPNLLVMGDLNLPLELGMVNNQSEKTRAKHLAEYFSSLGLTDCWKKDDNRITPKGGRVD
jgi:hypothetical protein